MGITTTKSTLRRKDDNAKELIREREEDRKFIEKMNELCGLVKEMTNA